MFAKLFLEGGPDEVQAQARRLARRPEHPRRGPRPGDGSCRPASAPDDRDKLDEYFTSVRELEQRLAQAEEWAKKPKPKVDAKPPQNIPNAADLIGKTRLWFDLIHLALQTDSTRLVTLQLLGTSSVPPIPGVTLGHHDLSHHGKDPAKIAQLKTLELEKMKTLRDFLTQAEGDEGRRRQACSTGRWSSSAATWATPAPTPSRTCRSCWPAAASSTASTWPSTRTRTRRCATSIVSMLQRLGIEADKFGSSTGTLTGLEPRG